MPELTSRDTSRKAASPHRWWAVGAEIELFGFTRDGLQRIDPDQVQAIINGFAPETISHVTEDGYVTEAILGAGSISSTATAIGRLTLEPGGQIEFSGAPARSLVEIERALSGLYKKARRDRRRESG